MLQGIGIHFAAKMPVNSRPGHWFIFQKFPTVRFPIINLFVYQEFAAQRQLIPDITAARGRLHVPDYNLALRVPEPRLREKLLQSEEGSIVEDPFEHLFRLTYIPCSGHTILGRYSEFPD